LSPPRIPETGTKLIGGLEAQRLVEALPAHRARGLDSSGCRVVAAVTRRDEGLRRRIAPRDRGRARRVPQPVLHETGDEALSSAGRSSTPSGAANAAAATGGPGRPPPLRARLDDQRDEFGSVSRHVRGMKEDDGEAVGSLICGNDGWAAGESNPGPSD
jgi:hypothetical protein